MKSHALFVELTERQRYILACPELGTQGLHGRIDTVMNVLNRNTVAANIVPHRKHSSENLLPIIGERKLSATHNVRCPVLIEILGVKIVIIVSGMRHYVGQTVRDANGLVAQLKH